MEDHEAGIERRTLMARAEGAPDEMNEVPRELTMLRGAVSSLHGVAGDLLGQIAPVVRDEPENDTALREIPTKFPVTTEVSRLLRDIYDEVSTIESKLARARNRIQL